MPFVSLVQDWKLVKDLQLKEPISSVSIDTEERIYIGSALGTLERLVSTGQKDESFSDISNSEVTSIEAWNKFKIFIFFRDQQKIAYLDRFTTTPVHYNLSDYGIDYGWYVAPGIDNSIWILSTDYNELRKYDTQLKQRLLSTPLSIDISGATHMRAYQNLLIISDKNQGLLFFDQFGNLLKQVNVPGIEYFQLKDGKMIFLASGYVHTLDPFKFSIEEKIKAPKGAFKKVIVSGTEHYFISKDQILIYQRAHEPR